MKKRNDGENFDPYINDLYLKSLPRCVPITTEIRM